MMRSVIVQISESFWFAWQALRTNLLRTTLSLLGVTVGIFAIISVFTMVDSLQRNIKQSLDFLGSNVLYVQKWPWGFGNGEYQWWKYFQRPTVKYEHFRFLKDNLGSTQAVCAMDFEGGVILKNKNNSFSTLIQGVTYDYSLISEVPLVKGRYFLPQEIDASRNVAIIGSDIATELFPDEDPLGKEFTIKGNRFMIIAVQAKKGKSLVDFGGNPDTKCLITYGAFAKMFQGVNYGIDVVAKAYDSDKGSEIMESEIRGLMRQKRGLKPMQDDNFAINRPDAAAKVLEGVVDVLTLAGWIIGLFSILVGGFGIANIMFVSVKERTNIIGIQKSLGAKNYFILFQFLFEAVFLSLIGGLVGVLLVYFLTFLPLGSLDLRLSSGNIIMGLSIASIIGIVSGIVPAWIASRLDPVTAIRSK